MDQSKSDTETDEPFPPEKRLEAPSIDLIRAGITTIPDMETLRACIAYENRHQNRTPILERLERKAVELRAAQGSDDNCQ